MSENKIEIEDTREPNEDIKAYEPTLADIRKHRSVVANTKASIVHGDVVEKTKV